MNKKEIAIAFLRSASSGKVKEAYKKYIHPDFLHHNPYFPGDRESLLKGMEKNAIEYPNKHYEVIHALEDGNMVAVHGWVQLASNMPKVALFHLFRLEGNLIIEEWETTQEIPRDSINKNGMF